MLFSFRNLGLATSLALSLGLGNVIWAAPSVQSIEVSPNPVTTGQNFTIAVTASPEVTRATALVAFRTGQPRLLHVPLVKQGQVWTGSGLVPSDIRLQLPHEAGAMVKVHVFDADYQRAEGVVQLGVKVESISAVFTEGVLTITGDDQENTIVASRDPAGTILVNGGAVPVTGDIPTTNNTSLIRAFGLGGNDVLQVDDSNGLMPPANLFGGEGDDMLTGSANADELTGDAGDDTLFGRDGNDNLVGGPGNDSLTGGRGVDPHLGGEGDDQIVWNPGDGSELVEGEDGEDTLLFIGSNAAEFVNVSANGQRLQFFRDVGNITMDCDGIERVIFQALGGADQVTVNDLTGTQVANVAVDLSNSPGESDNLADFVLVNGTSTNEVITITGSAQGVDVLGLTATVTVVGAEAELDELVVNALGGTDIVDASAVEEGSIRLTLNGGAGNDELIGGAGDDTFVWNPGDGSDVLEGQSGQDAMIFIGSNAGEAVDLSADGQRLRFFRNAGSITMDCNEVETIQFIALGNADTITLNDLSGTGVTNVSLNLESVPGSGLGDNQPDTVIVTGTPGNDVATVNGTPAGLGILGLSAMVNIVGSESALDQLIINLLAGDDVADASDLQAGVTGLTLVGGEGNDVLIGSDGADQLLGGDGDDVLQGGPALDTLDGGPGDNVVIQD